MSESDHDDPEHGGEGPHQGHGNHDHGHGDNDPNNGHDHHRHDVDTLGVALVTVSSSRSMDEDPAGDALETAVEDAGHDIVQRDLVSDDFDGLQGTVDRLVGREDTNVVVTTGGTGVTPDDVTVEAVRPLLDKELPGFGEVFRRRSADEIGTRVIGTRAMAGIEDGVVVFCLPGSENAARLGAELILAEAPHLVGLVQREDSGADAE